MLEKNIEAKFKTAVESLGRGVMCLKFESPGCTGVPDRIVLLPGGRVIFVELKQPGEKERARQRFVQKRMRDIGFEVWSAVSTQEQIGMIVRRCEELIEQDNL